MNSYKSRSGELRPGEGPKVPQNKSGTDPKRTLHSSQTRGDNSSGLFVDFVPLS